MLRPLFLICLSAILLLATVPAALADKKPILDGDKPLVLMIYDTHCKKWCGQVRPILDELKTQYGDRVVFYELDFSEKSLKASSETAKQLGVLGFVQGIIDWIPAVGIFTASRKPVKELTGLKKKSVYEEGIEKALKEK
jgi:thioredoxin-like negative regulator of GroEL